MIKIRKGTIKDIDKIAEHWYKEDKLESTLEPMYKLRKNAKKIIIKELKKKFKKKDFIVFVAEDSKKIIGSFIAWIEKAYELWTMDKMGHLAVAYVEPNYRKKGITRKLLREVINWFKSKDIKFVNGFVVPKNKVARETWKKLGLKDLMMYVIKEIK